MSDFFSDYSVVFGTIMTVYAHLFLPLSLKDWAEVKHCSAGSQL